MNVREYLRENELRITWLQAQLKQRGYDVELSHLLRIITGERQSDRALEILNECRDICRIYDTLKVAMIK